MDPGLGFEPRMTGSEPGVMPFHYPGFQDFFSLRRYGANREVVYQRNAYEKHSHCGRR